LEGEISTFSYVNSSPLNNIDPTGLNPASLALRAALAAIALCGKIQKCRCKAIHDGYGVLCRMPQCGGTTNCADAIVRMTATNGCISLRALFIAYRCNLREMEAHIKQFNTRVERNLPKCIPEIYAKCCGG